ncbi:MAG: hypothetical protein E7266_03105 [Lachnospiraceae bacterium]|nr:hypothetical protein [Lachnospiraceae bacterium]
MAIRLSGMVSGLDTDAMIDELVAAYSTKKDNIYKEQKTLEYKQDAWKAMNTSVYGFYSGTLSSMRFSSGYSLKTTSVSDTAKAIVSASSNAVNGTQELKITSLAKTGYLTGAKLDGVKGSSTLGELGITGSSTLAIATGGKTKEIEINESMTVDKLVSAFKDAGVNASFDEENQRFFISAKDSGADADFSLTGISDAGNNALKALGLYTVSTADVSSYQSYIDAAAADPEFIANESKKTYLDTLLNGKLKEHNQKVVELKANISKQNDIMAFADKNDEDRQTAIDELQKKIDDINAKLDPASEGYEALTESDKNTMEAKLAEYTETMNVYSEIQAASEAGTLDEYKANVQSVIDGYNTELTETEESIADIKSAISGNLAAKEQAYFGEEAPVYDTEEYNEILQANQDRLAYAEEKVQVYTEYLTAVENGDKDRVAELEAELGITGGADGAVRIAGADAEIYLNGARFTSTTNSFNINGLSVTAMGLTDKDETISVTTATDIDGIYNKIKDMFKEYNELIKQMETAYNAASAGDYKPLTDEEMEEMTDKQIEKWEDKLTTAALRKDSTLSGVISALKTVMAQSFTVNGESFNLGSFGIKTSGYFGSAENERGVYHIDGDPDDKSSSGNEDKLKAALANDPDTAISFFTQLSNALYSKLSDKMKGSTVSSAYTLYNDKSMKAQYEDYDDKLEDWEEKIEEMREKYVKQFSAMESALAELNSQQSSLSSLLGM